MPIIHVEMFEGRTTDQRRKLAKELTEGTCRALGCHARHRPDHPDRHQERELG